MPVSGITVVAESNQTERLKNLIESQYQGEISAVVQNHLVVVLEAPTNRAMKDKFEAIAGLDGVVSTRLAYYSEEV
jgi:nitrate reductase NapAB chaperone NapD